MNFRLVSATVLFSGALFPILSIASPEQKSLDACVKAFSASFSESASKPIFKVAHPSADSMGSFVELYARDYSFDLTARDSKTGEALASAHCNASATSKVLALLVNPISANVKLAAKDSF
jgi:hypothetical protein